MARLVGVAVVVAFVGFLVVVGWDGGTEGADAESTTSLTEPSVSAGGDSMTASSLAAIVATSQVSVESVTRFESLVAVSVSESWAVVSTEECLRCMIGHLEGERWTFWRSVGDDGQIHDLTRAADGTMWAASDFGVFSSSDGADWTRRRDGPAGGVEVSDLGTVWVGGSRGGDPPVPWLSRWDGGAWQLFGSELPDPVARFTPMVLTNSGAPWIAVFPYESVGDVVRYDGGTVVPIGVAEVPDPDGDEGAVGVVTIACSSNGDVWVGGFQADDRTEVVLASFDGSTWITYSWPFTTEPLVSPPLFELSSGPDGGMWLGGEGGIASFNGSAWTVRREDPRVISIDVAPDGSVWYSNADGLHRLEAFTDR